MSYRWPGGAGLALSLVINVEEGAEQNIDDGDKGPEPVDELQAVPRKPIRAHAAASNYQYGLNEAAPRILRLLDEYEMPATWTAAGLALLRRPDLARAIAARGDEVCSHGYRWIPQFEMNEAEEREFIAKAAQAIEQATGERPVGWLSRYLYTDHTRRLLLEAGFRYHMDDFSADAPFWDQVAMADGTTQSLAILPYALDTNDMKFWLDPSYTPSAWLDYAIATLDWLHEEAATAPRMMSLGMHLRIIGRPGRIGALKAFLDYAAAKPGLWIATRAAIARHFAASVPPAS
jgi:peptidoglycan/xylan/chitin deacetylase (PgdA/CDA1 family)